MSFYISAYDTEAVFAWWEKPTGPDYAGYVSYQGERLEECLTGQPGLTLWPPQLPWDYPARMPTDAQGVYQAYAPGIDHLVASDHLYYLPIFHPWSVYRIDRNARQLDLLLRRAEAQGIERTSCTRLYEYTLAHDDLVPDASPDNL
ncbi:MAG: hypothetical protein GKR89_09870 [Candidatus Latescibacteria bacterium]|nr:hypothetical protein [Candidatus Latescibacterota bacterium]